MGITSEELERVAIIYINSDWTIGGLADSVGISRTTLVRYFSGKAKVKLSPQLQMDLDRVKYDKWLAGKSTNGNLGHKKYSDEEMIKAATAMVEKGLTLRDLDLESDASLGTLYTRFNEEVLGADLYAKVVGQYGKNLDIRTVPRKNRTNLSSESDSSQLSSMVDEAIATTNSKSGKSK